MGGHQCPRCFILCKSQSLTVKARFMQTPITYYNNVLTTNVFSTQQIWTERMMRTQRRWTTAVPVPPALTGTTRSTALCCTRIRYIPYLVQPDIHLDFRVLFRICDVISCALLPQASQPDELTIQEQEILELIDDGDMEDWVKVHAHPLNYIRGF